MIVPGGKGVNIALTLQLLGNNTIATGFAGGHSGHMLCDTLRQHGITTSFIFIEEPTRTNISILDQEHETLTEINERGQLISNEEFEFFLENYERLLHRADFVVIAGSLPRGLPDDAYGRMIQMAKEKGLKVIIHTSPKYMNPIIDSAPFLINPDMRSYHTFMGNPLDGVEQFLEAGKKIIKENKDTQFVLFTHRLENVVAVTRCHSYVLRPRDLKIVNMLGYADSYLSGFIHAYRKKELTIPEILRFASSAGLANVETLYKEISDYSSIFKNLNRIDIEEIK